MSLDDDVAVLLERVQSKRKASMKEVVNDALRAGLTQMIRPPEKQKPFRTKTLIHGPRLIEDITNVSELLARVEGENYR